MASDEEEMRRAHGLTARDSVRDCDGQIMKLTCCSALALIAALISSACGPDHLSRSIANSLLEDLRQEHPEVQTVPHIVISVGTTVRLMMTSRLASPIIADSWMGVLVAAI